MLITAFARKSTCGGQLDGTADAQGARGSRGRGRGGDGPEQRRGRRGEYEDVGQHRAAEKTRAVIAWVIW